MTFDDTLQRLSWQERSGIADNLRELRGELISHRPEPVKVELTRGTRRLLDQLIDELRSVT